MGSVNLLSGNYDVYVGAGIFAKVVRSRSQSKFGLSSVALVPTKPISGQEESVESIGLYMSSADPYQATPDTDIVNDNAKCAFSVWYLIPLNLRPFISSAALTITTWAELGSSIRQYVVLDPGLEIVGEWVKFEGEFVTPSGCRYIAPAIYIQGQDLPLGTPVVYVDRPMLVYGGTEDLPGDPFWTRGRTVAVPVIAVGAGLVALIMKKS